MARQNPLGKFIFFSRWLQVPLYLGLIVAQVIYVGHFLVEVYHLVTHTAKWTEVELMLAVLGLIDIVLISNLLIMVIIGGYETFVSRLGIEGHPDEPEWLDHVSSGALKIKVSLALVSISAINLLKTFINVQQLNEKDIMWQVIIHMVFLISALVIAWIDRISHSTALLKHSSGSTARSV